MTVDDAEVVFGKRWHQWAEDEKREFIRALEPENLRIAYTLQLAINHPELLQEHTRDWLLSMAKPRG